MKVSGFTFCRNAVRYDYPVVEAIQSILPIVVEFVGDYWSTNPWFYHKAVRIIRNNGEVESCGDAVGFQFKATGQYLQSGPGELLAPSGARVFHYGWVKDPKTMLEKKQEMTKVYH